MPLQWCLQLPMAPSRLRALLPLRCQSRASAASRSPSASSAATLPVPAFDMRNSHIKKLCIKHKATLEGLPMYHFFQCPDTDGLDFILAVARCPFQSCKSCCAKAQNPCHIHVLKIIGTLPDKPPPASSPLPEQPSNDTSPSLSGAAMRLSSLRQLSNTFINSLRTRKPLSRKDAENINKWRFAKLKEHIEGIVDVENEAFDRYMQNVSLLEETFFSNSLKDRMPIPEACSSEDDFSRLVTGIKVRLKSNPERANNFRERIQGVVNKGLEKLKVVEFHDDDVFRADDLDSFEGFKRQKMLKSRFNRTAAVEDLVDKLIKARTEDDLKSCLETKLQLFNQDGCLASCKSSNQIADVVASKDSNDAVTAAFSYSLPKLFTIVQTGEDSVSNIDEEFCSHNCIAEL